MKRSFHHVHHVQCVYHLFAYDEMMKILKGFLLLNWLFYLIGCFVVELVLLENPLYRQTPQKAMK